MYILLVYQLLSFLHPGISGFPRFPWSQWREGNTGMLNALLAGMRLSALLLWRWASFPAPCKPKGSSMLIIFFPRTKKTISFLISSSSLNHPKHCLSLCGTLAAFHFCCLSDGPLASLQEKWLFVATKAENINGFSLFHTLMWPS